MELTKPTWSTSGCDGLYFYKNAAVIGRHADLYPLASRLNFKFVGRFAFYQSLSVFDHFPINPTLGKRYFKLAAIIRKVQEYQGYLCRLLVSGGSLPLVSNQAIVWSGVVKIIIRLSATKSPVITPESAQNSI